MIVLMVQSLPFIRAMNHSNTGSHTNTRS
jgi:hypothetical protein